MPRATAQIVIYLDPDTGEIRAEMPSPSGVRRKIDVPREALNALMPDLLEMNTWLRDQERRREELEREAENNKKYAEIQFQRALHRKVWDQTASTPYTGSLRQTGMALANADIGAKFANRVIGPKDPSRQNAEDVLV